MELLSVVVLVVIGILMGVYGKKKEDKKKKELLDRWIKGERLEEQELKEMRPDRIMKFPEKKEIESEIITKPTTTNTDQVLTGIKNDIKNLKDRVIKVLKEFTQSHGQYLEIIEKVKQSVSNEDQSLSDEEFIVKILKSLNENNKMLRDLGNYLEKTMHDSRQNELKLYQILGYMNKETNLLVNKSNALEIIDKVSNEPKISKEYRSCAIDLYQDLARLEEKYQNTWYWGLLRDGLLSKLKESMDFFTIKNEEGKTIYDRYFGKEIPLRDIEIEHIKKIVSNLHWFRFWDGLIRMSDFFNTYFDDEMVDIKFVLGHYSEKSKKMLSKLGYAIDHFKPLSIISSDYKKEKDIEQIDNAFIKEVILKNLVKSGNKKFLAAVENIPDESEMVVYVERLGLVDKLAEKPITITNLQFGAYNQDILHAYISSL